MKVFFSILAAILAAAVIYLIAIEVLRFAGILPPAPSIAPGDPPKAMSNGESVSPNFLHQDRTEGLREPHWANTAAAKARPVRRYLMH